MYISTLFTGHNIKPGYQHPSKPQLAIKFYEPRS